MPKRNKIITIFSAISATIITYLTLTTTKCDPRVLDCYTGKVGGWPLKFRILEGGTVAYFNTNYLAFFADWLIFFIIILLLTNFLVSRLDKYGVIPPGL